MLYKRSTVRGLLGVEGERGRLAGRQRGKGRETHRREYRGNREKHRRQQRMGKGRDREISVVAGDPFILS